jgi:hypothetical protein
MAVLSVGGVTVPTTNNSLTLLRFSQNYR